MRGLSKEAAIKFAKNNLLALSILTISVGAILFFVAGILSDLIYFSDPRHQNQPLERWMTPRYVSMSYDLPPRIVDDVMGLEPDNDKFKHLDQVAANLGISLSELQERVLQAQEELQACRKLKRQLQDSDGDLLDRLFDDGDDQDKDHDIKLDPTIDDDDLDCEHGRAQDNHQSDRP